MLLCPNLHPTEPVPDFRGTPTQFRFCPECDAAYNISRCRDTDLDPEPPSRKDIAAGDDR